MSEVRTYSGPSLDALLPKIREELGEDALIVRQREGVVGGVGGFFGRRIVEVEAKPALPVKVPSVPARAVVDAYDLGDVEVAAPLGRDPEPSNGLFELLLEQAAPFVPDEAPASELEAEAEPVEADDEDPEPAPPVPAARVVAEASPNGTDAFSALRSELLAAALPVKIVGEILEEVEQHLLPFASRSALRTLTRSALARRIPVAHGWRSKRRTIALVGPASSGRTLAAASLCAAYANAGTTVSAISLEPLRKAMELADLLRSRTEIELQVAEAPELVARARRATSRSELVVADIPALTPTVDGAQLEETLELLAQLKPDETHLVLPTGTTAAEGRVLLDAVAPLKSATRIVVSNAGGARRGGVPVGLSLADRIPISFVSERPAFGWLRPAEPDALARMVLP